MSDTNPSVSADARIVRAAIHPAIGVARVGNSKEEYFIGPEVTHPRPEKPGFYKEEKDKTGALKRQAAQFRIYGYDADGKVVRELTANDADIRWTVHVANNKAAWYQFQVAMDIPEAVASKRRNEKLTGDQRDKLVIDPGPRTITGRRTEGAQYRFESGRFFDKTVYLGEVRTDNDGRLLFLGGRGDSASYNNQPAQDFANNDGWHDDTADGPVTAEVTIGGRTIPVEGAWVFAGPPNYAPDVVGIRTLYDLLLDAYYQAGMLPRPTEVSFTRDIYPILERFCGLQWVNQGFAGTFGWGGAYDFLRPDMLARLAAGGSDPANAKLRQEIFAQFRVPGTNDMSPKPWPWVYGDAMNIPANSPRQNLSVSPTQYAALQQWAAGSFVADWDPARKVPRTLAEVPVADQPAMLDQAALHFCLADAFHPGCEVTWPIRHVSMFSAPFRIRHRPAGQAEPDYGPVLTPARALGADGPLHAQGPGDLTRWMAVPWQTDTSSCRSGYDRAYDPYVPTFWPARVPNHVISSRRYESIVKATDPATALAQFRARDSWFRGLTGSYQQYINQMVRDFGKMGVVERMEVPGKPGLPQVMMVETGFGLVEPPQVVKVQVPGIVSAPEGVEMAGVAAEAVHTTFASADAAPAVAAPVSPHAAAGGFDSEEVFEEFVRRVGTSAHDG